MGNSYFTLRYVVIVSCTAPLPTIFPLAFGRPITHALNLQSHCNNAHKEHLDQGFACLFCFVGRESLQAIQMKCQILLGTLSDHILCHIFCEHSDSKGPMQQFLSCHGGADKQIKQILLSKYHFLWQPKSVYLQCNDKLEAN